MAYTDESLLEDQNDTANATVSGGAPIANTSGPATATAASQKSKTPTNFANLSEYLRVNKPQEFGSQVAGKIGEDVNQAQNTLANSESQFKERADANTVTDKNNLIGQVGTAPEGIDKAAFTGLRDAEYKGPANFSDTQDLYNQTTGQAGAAAGKANASKTEGGRFALLDNYFGKPSYSQGQKSLDNLLIQNDDNSKQAFSQMQQNATALQSKVGQTTQQLGEYGNTAKQKTVDTRAAARGALGIDDAGNLVEGTGAIGGTQKDIADQFASRKAAQAADDTAIRQALTSGDYSKLTPAQLAVVGQQAQNGEGNYGVDATKYLSKAELTAQNTQSPEQQRRLAALGSLAGMDDLGAPMGDGSDVGKYATDTGVGLNFDALTNAISGQKQAYQTEINAPAPIRTESMPWLSGNNLAPAAWGGILSENPALAQAQTAIKNKTATGAQTVDFLQSMMTKAQQRGDTYLANSISQELNAQKAALNAIDAKYGVNNAAGSPVQGQSGFLAGYKAPVVKK